MWQAAFVKVQVLQAAYLDELVDVDLQIFLKI
jgi:hypothetical protein